MQEGTSKSLQKVRVKCKSHLNPKGKTQLLLLLALICCSTLALHVKQSNTNIFVVINMPEMQGTQHILAEKDL